MQRDESLHTEQPLLHFYHRLLHFLKAAEVIRSPERLQKESSLLHNSASSAGALRSHADNRKANNVGHTRK